MAVQRDGKIVVGFQAPSFAPVPSTARLNLDGSVDPTLQPVPDMGAFGSMPATLGLAIQPDGQILAGIEARISNGFPGWFLVRMNPTGAVSTVVRYWSGPILAPAEGFPLGGGVFFSFREFSNLALDGSLHTLPLQGFSTDGAYTIALQQNGSIVVGGLFDITATLAVTNLVRFNPDGSLDASFFAGPGWTGADGAVHRILALPQGKTLVAGDFRTIQGASRRFLASVRSNGAVDLDFDASLNGPVLAMAIQHDGKILIGGSFTEAGTHSRAHLARLLPDGSVDETFDPGLGPDGPIRDLAIAPDGDIVILGDFTSVDGTARSGLARIRAYELRLDPPHRSSNGEVLLRLHGQPGMSATIESSPDLNVWSFLRNEILTGPQLDLLESNTAGKAQRFYRVLPQNQ